MSNFMNNTNSTAVFGAYANEIKKSRPITITWAAYQALTETEKAAHRYIITDYPSQGIIPTYALYNLSDVDVDDVENGNLLGFDIASGEWVPIEVDTEVTEDSTNPVTSGAVYDAIDNLGSASAKDFTTAVTENSTDLVTSGAVYDAIQNAINSFGVAETTSF